MEKGVKRTIKIETRTKEECMELGGIIHNQLKGNDDYINNNIILNCTEDDNIIRIYIFEECKIPPTIKI